MSLDAIPSGFSSAAAVTLLKAMRSTQSANAAFVTTQNSPTLDARSKSSLSGNLMFSIIAAAANAKGATSPPTRQDADEAGQGDSDRATELLNDDPYFQKSYTMDEAAQNYYALSNKLADSLRLSGLTTQGQTNGQVMADLENFKGQQAVDFAKAFDDRALKVTDAATIGVDAKMTRTYLKSEDGVYGESIAASVDDTAWMTYLKSNPNTIWTDDHGYKGTGGGLVFSW